MQKVKFRYLGKSLLKGRPKREFIVIEGAKYWNCRRFQEQLPDLSYLRPIEFYERNKKLLDNKHLFITEFVEKVESPVILNPQVGPELIPDNEVQSDIPEEDISEQEPQPVIPDEDKPKQEESPKHPISTRNPKFIEFGVTEFDGKLQCPKCRYNVIQTKKMLNHISVIHKA